MARDGGIVDQYAERIRASWEKNESAGFSADSLQKDPLDEQKDNLKAWLKERQEWISENIDTSLDEVNVSVFFYVDGEYLSTVTIPMNPGVLAEENFPEAPVKEGAVFAGWETDKGEIVGPGYTLINSTPVYAVFQERKE